MTAIVAAGRQEPIPPSIVVMFSSVESAMAGMNP